MDDVHGLWPCRFHEYNNFGSRMSKKRPLSTAEKANFEKCLALPRASRDVVRKIWNIASELRPDSGVCGVADGQRADEKRLAEALDCYVAQELEAWDGGRRVPVYLSDIQKALTYMARRNNQWENALANLLEKRTTLTPIWYLDDVHCGNILAAGGLKKISAYYASFQEFGCRVHSEMAWLPVAALQRPHADQIQGGLSAVLKAVLHLWKDKRISFGLLGHCPTCAYRHCTLLLYRRHGLPEIIFLQQRIGRIQTMHVVL